MNVKLLATLAVAFAVLPATAARASSPPVDIKVNFQDQSSAPPDGYVRDFGEAFGARGDSGLIYGWVSPDTGAPIDLAGNGRNRGEAEPDRRLATFMHMQLPANAESGTHQAGDWEIAVPPGNYTVSLALGDPNTVDSIHTLAVEGEPVVTAFTPNERDRFIRATRTVSVSDARLTLSAVGGTNTKVDYIDITSAPTSLTERINFQDESTQPPEGYVRDFGQAFGTRPDGHDYGWVKPGTDTPVELIGNGRHRPTGDLRQATFVHMQLPAGSAGVHEAGSWELAVPNGRYSVSVGVGESEALDSSHWVSIEDQNAVAAFAPTPGKRFTVVTRTVAVSDGRITLSAAGGTNTKLAYVDVVAVPATARPRVRSVHPANLANGVNPAGSAVADLVLPDGGVDPTTLSEASVSVRRVSDGLRVPGVAKTSGGGDTIEFSPSGSLQESTVYRFDVTAAVKDLSGGSFEPFSAVFTTGRALAGDGTVSFDNAGAVADGLFTSVAKGPDGSLYAATLDGSIQRWHIAADGTLTDRETITTVRDHAAAAGSYGAPARTIIGLAFDPSSTADDPVLWIADNAMFAGTYDVPDLSSSVAKLSGPGLGTYTEVIAHLPRSIKDHEVNSLAFGPDGALYFNVGALNAMGALDATWQRDEHLLSAATLRLDVARLPERLPLDARTGDVGGDYDPFAPGAPLTVYASGVRNAFDLVWHRNGHLYVPTNGSAAGGNVPASPSSPPPSCSHRIDGAWSGPQVPAITGNPVAETDYIFDVKPGRYYGHPNPARCEWVLNGGNPTSAPEPLEVGAYPPGTAPDRNYDAAGIYDAGLHASADGAIEYRSDAFGDALQGDLLVARYSAAKDVVAFSVADDGRLVGPAVVAGMSGLAGPLDLAEDPANGNVYVSELDAGRLTLFRPRGRVSVTSLDPAPARDRLAMSRIETPAGPDQRFHDTAAVRIANTGGVRVRVTGLPITGPFEVHDPPSLPLALDPGEATTIDVRFTATTGTVANGSLTVQTSAGDTDVTLAGFGQTLSENGQEPSVAQILQVFGYRTQLPADMNNRGAYVAEADEVLAPYWRRRDDARPVRLTQLAAYHTQGNTGSVFWHPRDSGEGTLIGTHSGVWAQSVLPWADAQSAPVTGAFTPGAAVFGFRVDGEWSDPARNDEAVDRANGCTATRCGSHVRFFGVRDRAGAIVPGSYLMVMDYSGFNYDFNDNVYLLENIAPAG